MTYPKLNFGDGKKVFDSIHGTIHLTDDEVTIIDTPQFQRLRRINQLGFASYVFPEANHTRFSHSLGVLAVMDRLCQHLGIDKDQRYDLRLIALLHDIGHFPFSHTLEKVYEKLEREKDDFFSTAKEGKNITKDVSMGKYCSDDDKRKYAYHEECSSRIANQILKEIQADIPNKARLRITTSIIGQSIPPQYFSQLIHSSIDADNMDYLLRDSVKTGIPYGNYDFHYLSEAFEFDGNNKEKRQIVFKRKGLNAIEHFYLAKYYWYTQIISHPSLAIVENIAKYIAYSLITKKHVEKCRKDFLYDLYRAS